MSGISIPKKYDIVFIDAEPHAGHEFGGHNLKNNNIRRPFLVMSGNYYNFSGMIAGFPITHKRPKELPSIHVKVGKVDGYAVVQLLGYDYKARNAEIVGKINLQDIKIANAAIRDIFE